MLNVINGLADYGAPIIPAVDVKRIRLAIVEMRESQGLNQQELAIKAGIDQGHMSKIEDVDGQPLRDLAARIIFQVDLRHSFGALLYATTRDLATVARFLLHSTVATSERYARSAMQSVDRRAAELAGAALGRTLSSELPNGSNTSK